MIREKLEVFLLQSILRAALVSLGIIILTDIVYRGFSLPDFVIDFVVTAAVIVSIILQRFGKYHASVLNLTIPTLFTMVYQAIVTSNTTTMSLSVIVTLGLFYSILLRGKLMYGMHLLAIACIVFVFTIQNRNPKQFLMEGEGHVITMAVSYVLLYFIVGYSVGYLKNRYDQINNELYATNESLELKTREIEMKNKELMIGQDEMSKLNVFLENKVEERTQILIKQNERILKYTYNNAHKVRGSVARILGLIQVSKIESDLDYKFLFDKIREQSQELDETVKMINKELEIETDEEQS